ncbi:hypothetical protein SDC9_86765 [bioreactor metagenome]|uniref:Uncharacterized protein n=1 Tax=bioreactor metagenome TaxID=1076179 RepID=A0A644ZHD2_9ZZZZ
MDFNTIVYFGVFSLEGPKVNMSFDILYLFLSSEVVFLVNVRVSMIFELSKLDIS